MVTVLRWIKEAGRSQLVKYHGAIFAFLRQMNQCAFSETTDALLQKPQIATCQQFNEPLVEPEKSDIKKPD